MGSSTAKGEQKGSMMGVCPLQALVGFLSENELALSKRGTSVPRLHSLQINLAFLRFNLS